MRMRRSAVAVAIAMAATVSTGSTAVAAFAQPSFSAAHVTTGKPAKPSKPKKFAVSGSITAVAAGTITIAAQGDPVTVTVPSGARITVNGARKSLDDIATGYRVTVVGVRTGSVWTAVRVQARAARVKHTPSSSPSASPSASPSPSPSESESPEDD